jgi:hypothetical protein
MFRQKSGAGGLKKTLDVVFLIRITFCYKKAVAARCDGPCGPEYVVAMLRVVAKSRQRGT